MHIGDSPVMTSGLCDWSNDPHHTQCSPRPRRCRSLADMYPLHSRCSLRPHHCRWSPDTSQLRSQCTLFGPSHSDTAPPHTPRMMLSRHQAAPCLQHTIRTLSTRSTRTCSHRDHTDPPHTPRSQTPQMRRLPSVDQTHSSRTGCVHYCRGHCDPLHRRYMTWTPSSSNDPQDTACSW